MKGQDVVRAVFTGKSEAAFGVLGKGNPGGLVRVVDQAGLASMGLTGRVDIAPGARLEIGSGVPFV